MVLILIRDGTVRSDGGACLVWTHEDFVGAKQSCEIHPVKWTGDGSALTGT